MGRETLGVGVSSKSIDAPSAGRRNMTAGSPRQYIDVLCEPAVIGTDEKARGSDVKKSSARPCAMNHSFRRETLVHGARRVIALFHP